MKILHEHIRSQFFVCILTIFLIIDQARILSQTNRYLQMFEVSPADDVIFPPDRISFSEPIIDKQREVGEYK